MMSGFRLVALMCAGFGECSLWVVDDRGYAIQARTVQ
jgi:hypothetical protein